MDLKSYFDEIPHGGLLAKVAKRVNDDDVMHLLKLILKAGGKQGVPQGGVISPLLSNLYLNEVDEMLERARRNTMAANGWHYVQYARYADDLVVLVPKQARFIAPICHGRIDSVGHCGRHFPCSTSRSLSRRPRHRSADLFLRLLRLRPPCAAPRGAVR